MAADSYHTCPVEPFEPHLSLLTALAVGLLVGLEREQVKDSHGGTGFAGIRTYPIIALLGALATMLEPSSMWLPLVVLGGVIALVSINYAADVRNGKDHGITTEASVLAVYLLGALAASRGVLEPMSTRLLLTVALGVTLTFLLSSKQWLHGIAAKVSRDDFYATVKFLIAAVIVLPLLPREEMGPLDAINPFSVGLMVVMIAGLSFAGYVAMRLLGTGRGVFVSAAVGGLVSSTAVTIAFSNRTKDNPELAPVAAGAIAIASTIMIGRVAVLVAIVNIRLLPSLALPLVGAAVGAILGGLLVYRRASDKPRADLHIKNPFELGSAIRFGAVFAVILLATKAAKEYFGNQGLYLAALVAGGTDVDAVSLSTAKQADIGDPLPYVIAILIAIAANTIVKSSLAWFIGGRALGKRAFLIGALILVGGGAGALSLVFL